jgi:hypothetical protein
MKYTNPQDIIDNIKVGMKCAYYNSGKLDEDTLSKGIVTSIRKCNMCCSEYKIHFGTRWKCDKEIGINGSPSACFSYTGIFSIKYIKEDEFIEEDEFII